jgi:hypothetical protein
MMCTTESRRGHSMMIMRIMLIMVVAQDAARPGTNQHGAVRIALN